MGVDVEERCVWGLDCFTRKLVSDCLELCPELMVTAEMKPPIDVRSVFIEHHLLPALNNLGDAGW